MASNSLPPEQHASYTVIIDEILAKADLNTISAKQIREGLQKSVPYDIGPQKKAIKELIMQRFDKFHEEQESKAAPAVETVEHDPEPFHVNGVTKEETKSSTEPESVPAKRPADSDDSPSFSSPPPKKVKKSGVKSAAFDADAALAAKLQAEENARSRPTRGGGPRKAAPVVKKKTKKKSKDKISAEDDSDIDNSRPEKKVNRNTGFHKLLSLSPALSALLEGEIQLSRPQATKKLWTYIKANELQDPSDKRTIRCDDAMKAVFKQDKINMFAMTKIMSQNMYADGE